MEVWRLSLAGVEAHLERLTDVLSPEEQQRAARFHFKRDRQKFTATRGVLRLLLSRYLGLAPEALRFTYGAQNKPALAPEHCGVKFNVSHSHQLALLAFSRKRELGVDLEQLRSDLEFDQLAARFFSPREYTEWRTYTGPERETAFFRCWTRKEALLKALGIGLSGLEHVSVSLGAHETTLVEATAELTGDTGWSLLPLQVGEEYVAALAVAGPPPPVRIIDWVWAPP